MRSKTAQWFECKIKYEKVMEDVKDASLEVEDIVDRYVKFATSELRQQLIDKLTEIRKEKFGIE